MNPQGLTGEELHSLMDTLERANTQQLRAIRGFIRDTLDERVRP